MAGSARNSQLHASEMAMHMSTLAQESQVGRRIDVDKQQCANFKTGIHADSRYASDQRSSHPVQKHRIQTVSASMSTMCKCLCAPARHANMLNITDCQSSVAKGRNVGQKTSIHASCKVLAVNEQNSFKSVKCVVRSATRTFSACQSLHFQVGS